MVPSRAATVGTGSTDTDLVLEIGEDDAAWQVTLDQNAKLKIVSRGG